jgi:hypothetical protein
VHSAVSGQSDGEFCEHRNAISGFVKGEVFVANDEPWKDAAPWNWPVR